MIFCLRETTQSIGWLSSVGFRNGFENHGWVASHSAADPLRIWWAGARVCVWDKYLQTLGWWLSRRVPCMICEGRIREGHFLVFHFLKFCFPALLLPFSAFSCFASLLLFVSAFLLLGISASTLLCFAMLLCFSAFLLLCFSASPLLPFWLLKLKCPRTHVNKP